jgi:hypothetical protein
MAGAAAVASPDTDPQGPQGPQGPQANLCLASKSRNLTPPHTVQREIPTSSHRLRRLKIELGALEEKSRLARRFAAVPKDAARIVMHDITAIQLVVLYKSQDI